MTILTYHHLIHTLQTQAVILKVCFMSPFDYTEPSQSAIFLFFCVIQLHTIQYNYTIIIQYNYCVHHVLTEIFALGVKAKSSIRIVNEKQSICQQPNHHV